jgi:cell division septation protein DedD
VEETNGPGFTNLVPVEMVELEKPAEITNPKPPIITPKPNSTESNAIDLSVKYKIQLVALRDTRFFDGKKISHLGKIKDYQKANNITAKVIGDFSESNVRQILNEIRSAGFKDAFIVKEVNGELITISGLK